MPCRMTGVPATAASSSAGAMNSLRTPDRENCRPLISPGRSFTSLICPNAPAPRYKPLGAWMSKFAEVSRMAPPRKSCGPAPPKPRTGAAIATGAEGARLLAGQPPRRNRATHLRRSQGRTAPTGVSMRNGAVGRSQVTTEALGDELSGTVRNFAIR